MSIKSGQRYKITNEESGLVFDQSRRRYSVTNKEGGLLLDESAGKSMSIIGFELHGLDNQQVSELPYFHSLSLIQPPYALVDHRKAGRRPMDYSISQGPGVCWIRE